MRNIINFVVILVCLSLSAAKAQENKSKNENDLMTIEKCRGINSLLLIDENLSMDEIMSREKNTTFEVVKDMVCITKVNNDITGIFLMEGYKITSIDPSDFDKVIEALENF